MSKAQNDVSYYTAEPEIRARIIDGVHGMRFLPEVIAVRIRNKEYGILVMKDYMPLLGEINGSVVFLTQDGEIRFDKISGFYKHQHNEFTLLIESNEDM